MKEEYQEVIDALKKDYKNPYDVTYIVRPQPIWRRPSQKIKCNLKDYKKIFTINTTRRINA